RLPRRILSLFLLSVLTLCSTGNTHSSPPAGATGITRPVEPPFVPGELLIKFRKDASPSDRDSTRAQLSARRLRQFRSGAEHWKLGDRVSTEAALSRMHSNPRVQYAEPNYLVGIDRVPDDPRYPEMYALNNTGQTGGIPGADIRAENAWSVSVGSLMALKFLGADGSGSTADAIAAIDYGTTMGAAIMSNSWGGGGFSQALLDAINDAGAANVLFAAAAGNNGSNNDLFPAYPASY